MDDRQATPNEYAADRTGLAADDLAHDAANVAASGTKTAVRQGRKLLQCQREKWAAEKRQENTAPAEQPHSPGPAQGSAPDRHTPQRSGGTVPERQRLPQHKCMMEHPPTQAGIERPTDTTISYVERGRAFAKKQAEWNQQVKNQTVPPDWTPHIKSPDAVQASRQKELPVKTAKQPAQAMGQAAKNTIKRAQRTIKTAQHTAKTAPRTEKPPSIRRIIQQRRLGKRHRLLQRPRERPPRTPASRQSPPPLPRKPPQRALLLRQRPCLCLSRRWWPLSPLEAGLLSLPL